MLKEQCECGDCGCSSPNYARTPSEYLEKYHKNIHKKIKQTIYSEACERREIARNKANARLKLARMVGDMTALSTCDDCGEKGYYINRAPGQHDIEEISCPFCRNVIYLFDEHYLGDTTYVDIKEAKTKSCDYEDATVLFNNQTNRIKIVCFEVKFRREPVMGKKDDVDSLESDDEYDYDIECQPISELIYCKECSNIFSFGCEHSIDVDNAIIFKINNEPIKFKSPEEFKEKIKNMTLYGTCNCANNSSRCINEPAAHGDPLMGSRSEKGKPCKLKNAQFIYTDAEKWNDREWGGIEGRSFGIHRYL